jgi:short subunit dehydrogenase-like uncharacterized protein
MSPGEPISAIITGATGRVGTFTALFFARLGLTDRLYLASRDLGKIGTVLITRGCALS